MRDAHPGVATLHGGWGDDPLAQLAEAGELPEGLGARLAGLARLADWTRAEAPGMRAVAVSTQPYAEAGATAVDEVGIALATGVAYLRALDEGGVPWDACCGQLAFTVTAGADLFMDVAKLRALRRGWARVVEACGGSASDRAAYVHVRSTRRRRSRRDPWVNMLRATGESAAAAIGGADAVTVLPFDTEWGEPGELGRRIARNTPLVLQEESHLEHVADPARGGWYLETLTEEVLGRGWELLQGIEREGGVAAALRNGSIQRRIGEAAERRRTEIARRRMPLTGISSYPNLEEEPLSRAATDRQALRRAAAEGALAKAVREHASGRSGTSVEPLAPWREAEPFEDLRDRADRLREARGEEPAVFVAAVGGLARVKPRIDFTANLLAAGGLRAVVRDTCFDGAAGALRAFGQSNEVLAAIVAEDDDYPELVAELAPGLYERGARAVLLAGRPGDREAAFREAGVDEFVYLGCDARAVLDRLLGRLEVS
jgi:methylmalonyl-CoA mutase